MPPNLEEEQYQRAKANSPIHRWHDMDSLFEKAGMPVNLRRPLHELLILRGQYPRIISTNDIRDFGQKAISVQEKFGFSLQDMRTLSTLLAFVVSVWVSEGSENN